LTALLSARNDDPVKKSRGISVIAGAITFAVAAAIVFSALGCRTDRALSMRLERANRVWIFSEGRSLLPITAEGPFPRWSQTSVFLLKGPGEPTANGTLYRIGEDARSFFGKYVAGWVILDEGRRTVTLQGSLSDRYASQINHSGTYTCEFQAPELVVLDDPDRASALEGKFVKVTGTIEDRRYCRIHGGRLKVSSSLESSSRYELVGRIVKGSGSDLFMLDVFDSTAVD